MQILKKLHRVLYPLLIIIFLFLFEKGTEIEPSWLKYPIAIGLAYFLSPRKKSIQTPTGQKNQLVWIFLKKPIFLDS
jgi:hypothetical protein